jgi:hypothetical protein
MSADDENDRSPQLQACDIEFLQISSWPSNAFISIITRVYPASTRRDDGRAAAT